MEIITSTRNKEFNYIAFFDLDLTITKAISGRVLAQRAFKKGLMNRSDIANAIFLGLAYRIGFADPVKTMEKMLGWVKGMPEHVLKELCSEVVRDIMLPSVHSEVFDELKMHRSENATTVILSSSLVQICKEVADSLDIDDVICSMLEVKNGFLTGRPVGNLCYGVEKLIRLKEYCEKNNNRIEDSWYYGDSISDLPALEVVGHPVCINPDKKLFKAAKKNRWIIYFWK
jgi:HAD superfamily hydrolase (TIGR01490 family)